MTKHKHHDVIVAWANGETIEWSFEGQEWKPLNNNEPRFNEMLHYRVKPAEPVRKYPETTLTGELVEAFYYERDKVFVDRVRNVANAALRHAIDSGQVVMPEDEECRKYMPAGIAHLIQSYKELDRDFLEAAPSRSKFGKSKP